MSNEDVSGDETAAGRAAADAPGDFDLGLLRRLWIGSVAAGGVVCASALAWAYAETSFDWAWWLMAAALGVIGQSAAFYGLCSLKAPGLAAYLMGDETHVRGDDVVTTTHVAEAADPKLNAYVRAYANARGASMTAASVGLLIALALAVYAFS